MLAGPAWRPCPESPDSLGEAGQGRRSRCLDRNPRTLRGEAKASSPGPLFQGDKQAVSCLILAWIMASSPRYLSQQPIPPRWCLEFTCPLPCPPYLPVGSPGAGCRASTCPASLALSQGGPSLPSLGDRTLFPFSICPLLWIYGTLAARQAEEAWDLTPVCLGAEGQRAGGTPEPVGICTWCL